MRRTTSFLIMTLVLLLATGAGGCRTLEGSGIGTAPIQENLTVQASAISWITSPQMISNNQSSADSIPALVVDSNGVVHALWKEEAGGSLGNLTYANSADGFSTNRRIRTLVELHSPTMTIDSLGVVHVFWAEQYAGKWEIFYTNSSSDYQIKLPVSDNPAFVDIYPRVAVDANDILHVIWTSQTPGGYEIFYSNSTDFLNNVSVSHNPGITNQYAADILITPSDGTIHAVWQTPIGGGTIAHVCYANSTDRFATNQTIDNNPSYNNYAPRMVLDSTGVIHCFWSGYDATQSDIYYASSSDDFTSNTSVTTGGYDDQVPRVAIDAADQIHLLWRIDNGAQYDLYYASSNDNWVTKTKVLENPYDEAFLQIGIHQASNTAHIVFTSSNGTVANLYYASFSTIPSSGGIPGFGLLSSFIPLVLLGLVVLLSKPRKTPLI
jgi:hypothetical protein